jgi:hypothetical protein
MPDELMTALAGVFVERGYAHTSLADLRKALPRSDKGFLDDHSTAETVALLVHRAAHTNWPFVDGEAKQTGTFQQGLTTARRAVGNMSTSPLAQAGLIIAAQPVIAGRAMPDPLAPWTGIMTRLLQLAEEEGVLRLRWGVAREAELLVFGVAGAKEAMLRAGTMHRLSELVDRQLLMFLTAHNVPAHVISELLCEVSPPWTFND